MEEERWRESLRDLGTKTKTEEEITILDMTDTDRAEARLDIRTIDLPPIIPICLTSLPCLRVKTKI